MKCQHQDDRYWDANPATLIPLSPEDSAPLYVEMMGGAKPILLDGKKSFEINGDKFRPGISISNSEVGLASLSIAAFLLRLVCTNGMVSKTEISASYRHVSTKILDEFPAVMGKVSYELGKQKHQIGISMESPVENPIQTIESFNRQFQLNHPQEESCGVGLAAGDNLVVYL